MGALRDRTGRRLHRLVGRLVAPHVAREVRLQLDAILPDLEARAIETAYSRGRGALLVEPLVFGPRERLRIADGVVLNDAFLNTLSGTITFERDAFVGHRACVLTGTHDITRRGAARKAAVPGAGHDIVVGEGAWIGSGAIVLGPCRIGAHAVVASGAVVTADVEAECVVAGVPARVVRRL